VIGNQHAKDVRASIRLANIEHEDVSLGRIEGLEVASKVLLDAARRARILSD
jgi:hypothetical protein